jgi:hypothetical protein
MHYPIPDSPQEWVSLAQKKQLKLVDQDLIAAAIVGVIQAARSQGQSLADVRAQVLAEDEWLAPATRECLSKIVTQAWDYLP